MIVGRLAPSPTGAQHLGNARTYLIAWLAARQGAGRVILRIEDIDSPRVKDWAVQQAIDDLRWLGLDWDEGPDVGGPNQPYVQTERTESYRAALAILRDREQVYPCTCTRTDIANAASAPHLGQDGVVYPRTCAQRSSVDAVSIAEEAYCWRYRVSNEVLGFFDAVMGEQRLNPATELGDFPITRKGGDAAYQLAVVVDDQAMGVNQVVRGADLLPSTFRQIELLRSLNFPLPEYAHVPLVVGSDGRRLAKRHGDTRLSWFREQGVLPEAIIGWAAHSIGLIDREERVAAVELVSHFQWERIVREPTVVTAEYFVAE